MAFEPSHRVTSFFQNETPNIAPTASREERIAAIRARRVEIQEAQVQLNQQLAHYLLQAR